MKILFYFWIIFAIAYESIVMLNSSKFASFKRQIKSKLEAKENLSVRMNTFLTLNFFYAIWVFIGLFSSQWIVFLLILLISQIPKRYAVLYFIDAIITLAALLFILLNAYHLHIDLPAIIWSKL